MCRPTSDEPENWLKAHPMTTGLRHQNKNESLGLHEIIMLETEKCLCRIKFDYCLCVA